MSNLYAGLLSTVARGVMPAEVNSPEYQRQAVTLDEFGSNINAITFPTALTTWGKLDEIGLFDGVIAGKKVASQKIPPQFINEGDTVEIPTKNLVISSACPNLPAISLPSPNTLSFSWVDSFPKPLFVSKAGKSVLVVRIFIEEPFDDETVISIGDSNNPEQLVSHLMIYPTDIGEYSLSIGYTYPVDTPVFLYISNATHGSGVVIVTLEP